MLLLALFSCKSNAPLPTVAELDVDRYLGKWYEIARLPNSFEKGLKCVTAEYSLREDGKIRVLNSGVKDDGSAELSSSEGYAVVPDKAFPGQLKVTFFWPFGGDYYVIALDESYQWSLVGAPNRDYLWVLSRSPQMDEQRYRALLQQADSLGFNTANLERINQDCER